MASPKTVLLAALLVITVAYVLFWFRARGQRGRHEPNAPAATLGTIGFVTNFFDTLGIGSFATTTAVFRLLRAVPDELIPGTLNVGHTLPTVVQALIYITIVQVDFQTLFLLILAATAGSWLGASVVAGWPRRNIQVGMSLALMGAAVLMVMSALDRNPAGGDALALVGTKLQLGIVINFVLGALMTLGIGLYAPCMITVSLLGMNPTAAFPIMMGSCAFLMPVCSIKFIRKQAYDLRAALGLALGGVPAVLIAALIVRSLPLAYVRWLVVVVVFYTAITMFRSAMAEQPAAKTKPATAI